MAAFMEELLDLPLREVLARMQDRILTQTTYFGIPALKNPLDHWIYQELIHQTRPDVIIEIGNAQGGSTIALAHLCDLMDHGRVIGLDLSHQAVPEHVRRHPRITFITGDACQSFAAVTKLILVSDRVLVIEDSAHTYAGTLQVLRTFSPLVQPGGYFIIEDSICHHGLEAGPQPGPYEAIETFLLENKNFVSDRSRESFFITWNPKGYLKRIG
jgi:cephalosporin hydroxylase